MSPLTVALALLAPVPPPPQSAWEPPAMREARSLGESTRLAAPDFRTAAETSGYQETGTYEEAVRLYRKLEKASPYARLMQAGVTAEGRPMYVLIASKDRAFSAATARKTGKPVVFLQNGIHAGENGGKDAAIMLLRDVLVSKRYASWLDHVIILSIPVFNADGHEHISPYNRINENGPRQMGFRVTAQRLNLNRDYVKADTPEMRAWLGVYTQWLPDFLIDNHVTDGSDQQYDVTIATHTEQDIAAPVGGWVNNVYLKKLLPAMESDGHVVGWYGGGPGGSTAMPVLTTSPRFSEGYAAAQNRAAILVETHSLKSFKTRVWAHYDIMRHTLEIAASDGAALRKASLDADRQMAATKPGDEIFLEGRPGTKGEPYTQRRLQQERYTGPASGAPVVRYLGTPANTDVTLIRALEPRLNPKAPLGYIVPRSWPAVIEVLRAHGIEMTAIPSALSGDFESARFSDARFAAAPFEGRFLVTSFTTRTVKEHRTIPAGSMFVPTAQRAARLVMHLLEPAAPDSLVRWGFFQAIFEQKEYFSDYVFEPIAAQLLKEDASLRTAFEDKLKSDPAFAENPRARLAWLYQRSPYYEPDKDAYPVVRVAERTW
ncbi:MAG: M14 family metallopeptidase [Bryobacterales bacterium]|nr:M14 family metallopeptidase [Bryobacterales bacterium]